MMRIWEFGRAVGGQLLMALCFVALCSIPVGAQSGASLFALARILPADTGVSGRRGTVVLDLGLTQAVPYRVFTLDQPRRLVLDFREVDWGGLPVEEIAGHDGIISARAGVYRAGWSRLVLALDQPGRITEAGMQTDPATGEATVRVMLKSVSEDEFGHLAGAPDGVDWAEGSAAVNASDRTTDGKMVVVLDPGHGGLDPGAENGGLNEAGLMLSFARLLKENLQRQSDLDVVLTRNTDEFVSLDQRMAIARASGADVFLSLHADALQSGQANGATVYTLSEDASGAAAAHLVARHERDNIMSGVDLSDQDDVIAGVLMDIARLETGPRSEQLADGLVETLRQADISLYKNPRQWAGFSVLKAPDFPSVLIELGYLSSEADRKNLVSVEWQREMAQAIADGLQRWAEIDAAKAGLVRQ